jgi:hypothetical protein
LDNNKHIESKYKKPLGKKLNMGGAVSELRHQIRDHVAIAKAYPQFLEPYLIGNICADTSFISSSLMKDL